MDLRSHDGPLQLNYVLVPVCECPNCGDSATSILDSLGITTPWRSSRPRVQGEPVGLRTLPALLAKIRRDLDEYEEQHP